MLVVGDVMLDRYAYGTSRPVTAETRYPIVSIDEVMESLGGAANVAAMTLPQELPTTVAREMSSAVIMAMTASA